MYLLKIFEKPENIHLFAWWLYPHHITLETPLFHREILDMVSTSKKHIAIAAPRGHAKSTVVGLVYASWMVLYQKHHFILLVSDTYTQSVEFVNTIKMELESNIRIRWLFGDQQSNFWRDGVFITTGNVKVMARAQGQKIRGLKFRQYRPDLLIFDDLENDESVRTYEQRRKLADWFGRAALPALAKDGRAVVIGTILHHDSLLSNMINNKGEFSSWGTLMYKAITMLPDGTEQALWVEHLNLEILHRMKSDPEFDGFLGSIVFSQEYQNEPFSAEDAVFKSEWLEEAKRKGTDRALINNFIYDTWDLGYMVIAGGVDLAISKKDGSDYTAMAVIGQTREGMKLPLWLSRDKLTPAETKAKIVSLNERYNPSVIIVESNAYQMSMAIDLADTTSVPVKAYTTGKEKYDIEIGVNSLAIDFENGKWIFPYTYKDPYTQNMIDILCGELLDYPSGHSGDMLMALWFSVQGLRQMGGALNKVNQAKTKDVLGR